MLLYLGAVALLCFANLGSTAPQGDIFGIPADKIAHFSLFLPFPILAWGCFGADNGNILRILPRIALIFIAGILLGFFTEYIQGYLPGRCREMLDFLADYCGITASCLGITIIKLCVPGD